MLSFNLYYSLDSPSLYLLSGYHKTIPRTDPHIMGVPPLARTFILRVSFAPPPPTGLEVEKNDENTIKILLLRAPNGRSACYYHEVTFFNSFSVIF